MKEQNEHYTGNKQQINFKLSLEERQIIHEMASTTGLSLSEYCRIKCLMNEDVFIRQQKQITDLEREVKELKVKSSCFKNSNVDSNDILLKLTAPQRQVLERLYGNFSSHYILCDFKSEVQNDLTYNILYTLICIPQLENFDDVNDDGHFNETYASVFENKNYEYWEPVIKEAFPELINNDLHTHFID
jgi:hypothetical protein